MVEVPAANVVARPPLLIVAMLEAEELQATCDVKFFVVPSCYWPVAMNCWLAPIVRPTAAGVTTIAVSTGDAGVWTLVFPPPQPAKPAKSTIVNGNAQ